MHRAVRIALSLGGLLLLVGGGGLLIVALTRTALTAEGSQAGPSNLLWLVPAVLLLLSGAALSTVGSRTVAAITAGAMGLLLLLSAPALILIGFAFQQSDSTDFDPDRVALVCRTSGVVLLGLGVLLLALAIGWANSEAGRRRLHRVAQVLSFGYGSWLFLQGVGLLVYVPFVGAVAARSARANGGPPVHTAVLATSVAGLALLALFPGAVFVYHGLASYFHFPSGPLRLPPLRLLIGVFLLSIGLGALVLGRDIATGVALPPLHVLASLSAPLALVTLAARWSQRRAASPATVVTWRQVLLMMAWGMAVAATIAIILEGLALLYTILAFLIVRHDLSGMNSAQALVDALNNSQSDIDKTVRFLFLLVIIALLGPLIEEFSKGFGVRFLRSDRPSRYQAFVFGVASGAGFATVESVEYGLGALGQDVHRWWDTMLLRGGSGSLHALASGIVGLSWYQIFNGRRARGYGLFLIAFGLHGSWNAFNVLTVARIVPYFKDLSDQTLEIGLEVVLGLVALGLVAGIAALSRLLAREEAGASQLSGGGLATLILPATSLPHYRDTTRDTQRLPVLDLPPIEPERVEAIQPAVTDAEPPGS